MVPCRQWIIYAYPQGPQIGPMAAQKCLHKPVDEAKDHKAMTTKVPQQETNREPEKEAVKISRWLADARAFIDKHWPHAEGLSHPGAYQKAAENWYHALAQQGWSIAHWPARYGGADWPKSQLYQWLMLCQQAQTPPINTLAMSLIAPVLIEAASADRQYLSASETLLSEIASFESHWCLGLLEPVDAKDKEPTRVTVGDSGYVLTGCKRALADGLLASTELPPSGLWPKRILCLAMDSDDQWRVCAVPADRAGVAMAPVANQRGRWFHVTFDAVSLQPQDVLPVSADRLMSVASGSAVPDSAVLPSASSAVLGSQLALLKDQLLGDVHEDTDTLLTQLSEAEVALQGLRALEARALAPLSPQFPRPLPMAMLNLKSRALEQQIGALQLASFGYYAVPQVDGLKDHNQGPINPAGDSAILVSQALRALATSHYGWNPRDVLARLWLDLESNS
jgi:alkylation response protein AidB-like acyl-CoA dehydrogenase